MPIRHTDKGWFWGSKGPFASKDKALAVARAAYSNGYKENEMELKETSEFICTLFHSATVTHLMHLKTDSYAEHKALNKYYDGIVDLVDGLAESIQGKYGRIDKYPTSFNFVFVNSSEYISNLIKYVGIARQSLPQDSEIQNQVDTIADLLNTTGYLLTLK